jgi:Skp family chaperone for outer membrane proteins
MALRTKLVLPFALVLLLISGCELNGTGGVAVIDLDRVASATGHAKTINEKVQQFATEQEARLKQLQSELRQRVSDAGKPGETESTGQPPTSSTSSDDLAQARSRLTRELEQARLATQQLRQQLVREFTAEVQPIARAEAVDRGMTLVVVKQPGLIFVAPEVDITNAVIVRLKSSTK